MFPLVGLILVDNIELYEIGTFSVYISLFCYVQKDSKSDNKFFSVIIQLFCLFVHLTFVIIFRLENFYNLIVFPNIGVAFSLSLYKYIRFFKQTKKKNQNLIDHKNISDEIEKLIEKYKFILKDYNFEQVNLIKLILKENSEKWYQYSENIQEMYLKSLLQKKIIADV
ncbi:hypothetical protein NEF87_001514 [Candidatus Lokiarchaeum ossiferum]|uniref:Uncharacterized protein n=1 Tax=Candidatus Lokiarchaeum ossiferum TaxID=2951803 RepID=A0ABY6HRM7_9ARCH|nr:hypothetical protein NEF87_001514 [Candidatus Lokiarchaeum sp. B-35]